MKLKIIPANSESVFSLYRADDPREPYQNNMDQRIRRSHVKTIWIEGSAGAISKQYGSKDPPEPCQNNMDRRIRRSHVRKTKWIKESTVVFG